MARGPIPTTVKIISATTTGDPTSVGGHHLYMVGDDGKCYHEWFVAGHWHGPEIMNDAG